MARLLMLRPAAVNCYGMAASIQLVEMFIAWVMRLGPAGVWNFFVVVVICSGMKFFF